MNMTLGDPILVLRGRDAHWLKWAPAVPLVATLGLLHFWPSGAGWGEARLSQQLVPALVLLGVLIVVHEFLHLAAMRLCGDQGARVRFRLLVNVALSGDHAYRRNQYLAVLLAPIALLAPATLLASWWLYPSGLWLAAALAGLGHVAGCCTDVYLAWWVSRAPADSWIVNHGSNPLRVYASPS